MTIRDKVCPYCGKYVCSSRYDKYEEAYSESVKGVRYRSFAHASCVEKAKEVRDGHRRTFRS